MEPSTVFVYSFIVAIVVMAFYLYAKKVNGEKVNFGVTLVPLFLIPALALAGFTIAAQSAKIEAQEKRRASAPQVQIQAATTIRSFDKDENDVYDPIVEIALSDDLSDSDINDRLNAGEVIELNTPSGKIATMSIEESDKEKSVNAILTFDGEPVEDDFLKDISYAASEHSDKWENQYPTLWWV